jgi:hypothetical protein
MGGNVPRRKSDCFKTVSGEYMDKENIISDAVGRNLPEFLAPFFWDVDFLKLDSGRSSYFIISRLLELGDEKAVAYILSTFRRDELIEVVRNSRFISKRSRNFWRLFFHLENEPCIPKRYPTPFGDCLES